MNTYPKFSEMSFHLNMHSITKGEYDKARELGKLVCEDTGRFLIETQDGYDCLLYMHIDKKYYVGVIGSAAQFINLERFKNLQILSQENVLRVEINKMLNWPTPKTEKAA